MNKKEKLKILKAMYINIENQTPPFGLCESYCGSTKKNNCKDSDLIELGLSKPRKKFTHDWWYDWHDKAIRLRAITKAIKKLQIK